MFTQPVDFLKPFSSESKDSNIKINFLHGTTTLAFKFKHGVIVAVDSRATAGSWIGVIVVTVHRAVIPERNDLYRLKFRGVKIFFTFLPNFARKFCGQASLEFWS